MLGGPLTVSSATQDGGIIAEFEMVSSSIDELLLDDNGTRSFISLCQSERKITVAAIDDLLTTQPYEQILCLMKPEFDFGREQFALVMATALNPDEYGLPNELSGCQWLVDHIRQAKGMCNRLEIYLNRVRDEWCPTTIITATKRYLPTHAKIGQQRASLLIFLPDCRGFQEVILVDPIFTMALTIAGFQSLLAHELHHSIRCSLEPKDQPTQERFRGIAQVLFWLESEGIADSVSSLSDLPCESADSLMANIVERRKAIYPKADEYLRLLDSAMADILNGSVPDDQAYFHVVSVLSSDNAYHPVGHVMAKRIEQQLGHNMLVDTIGKPYRFLLGYQQAAKQIGNPESVYIFNDEVVNALGQIQWRQSEHRA